MAASPRALMKRAAGYLFCILALQTALVAQLANGTALLLLVLPPQQTAASSVARCAVGLWHHYRIAVLHNYMLSAAGTAACLALTVRGRLSTARTKEAQPPARMLRASMLLAVALSLAASVLAGATLFYVLQVRMGTVFACLSGAAKAGLWALCAMMGLACAAWHCALAHAALAIWYQ